MKTCRSLDFIIEGHSFKVADAIVGIRKIHPGDLIVKRRRGGGHVGEYIGDAPGGKWKDLGANVDNSNKIREVHPLSYKWVTPVYY